jgi:hypothetical protein
MWGEAAYGEAAYGEPADGTIPPFQNRNVFAVIAFDVVGAGAFTGPAVGAAEIEITAAAIGKPLLPKVRVIKTTPHSKRGKTGLSHTGLN